MLNAVLQLSECRLILDLRCTQLPDYVQYHTIRHTLEVCGRADVLALHEKIPTASRRVLLVAAVYHDAGYLQSYINHEALSCLMAKKLLLPFGYSVSDMEMVCNLIMATRIPQTPRTLMEQIICDAD